MAPAHEVPAEQAREALRLAALDPTRGAALAARVLRASGDPAVGAVAERALGLASVHLHDPDTALRHLRRALAHAADAGSDRLAAEARMTLAFAFNQRGQTRRALREIDTALAALDGVAHARALAQRAAILHQQGQLSGAVTDYLAALPVLRAERDLLWVQRTVSNLGLLHAFRHEYDAAVGYLEESAGLCARMSAGLSAAMVQENLGFVHSRRGDVPQALRHFAVAEEHYRAEGAPLHSLLVDRGELLLSVCLVAEAREEATRAVEELSRRRRRLALPEARLLLARAALLDGDPAAAAVEARRAVRELRRQQRLHWVPLARLTELAALTADERLGRVTPGQLARTAAELFAAGWPDAAVDGYVRAGALAVHRGRPVEAAGYLTTAARYRDRGPATRRARAWYGEALRRHSRGDPAGARRAATAGLRVLDEHRATLGATDLRAQVAGLRAEIVALALGTVIESGRAAPVLRWAERGRARQLADGTPAPSDDPVLAGYLAQLRATVRELDEVRGAGRPPGALAQRQVALERLIRDRCRQRPAAGPAGAAVSCPPVADLAALLDGGALAEFLVAGGELYAVTVVDGRLRLHRLGPVAAIEPLVQRIPFALRRLYRSAVPTDRAAGAGGLADASSHGALVMLRYAAGQLDLAVRPVLDAVGDRALVVVPTGCLQSVPWSMLPALAGRDVAVAPSAALWCAARQPPPFQAGDRATAAVLAVAGPGLPGAHREVEAVAGIHGVAPLTGDGATVEAVLRGLSHASLAHLATHGQLRADSPLFSALHLADGHLTGYDLERLERGPRTVVLAACDSGRAVVCAGDELLGLGAAFLARDTRDLVASVVPVPDAQTAPMMVALHRYLVRGRTVAGALAAAQQETAAEHPAVGGFICVGSGFEPALPSYSR